MMTGVLSNEASKWTEVIAGSGEKAILSPISAKNVEHVLSTATVRGPQKNLYTAVLPFISRMAEDVNGVSILTSLVKYGTPKTVEGVCKELLSANKELWTLKTEPDKELASSLGGLLDALVYREDCRGEGCGEVVSSVSSAEAEKLLSSAFTLPATGRLFSLDTKFATSLVKGEKGQKVLRAASFSASEKKAAVSFCNRVLELGGNKDTASKYLYEVFFVPAPDMAKRPREEIVLALVANAEAAVVSKIAKVMLKWSSLRELLQRDTYANIFSQIILRADDAEATKRIALGLFEDVGEIDAMLAGRKKSCLRLLTAIDEKPAVVAALEKKLGVSLAGKLRGSKVRYTNATVPRATATQQAIMAKLKRLRAGSTVESKQTRIGRKRSRE